MISTDEREMLKKPEVPAKDSERFTSLQPKYEDSVPSSEDDWELEDE
ncbi:MAG TPA: hypothetical protein VGC07_09665 [Granulicella sp.]